MTDSEKIEAFIREKGVTRIENGQWPNLDIPAKRRFNPKWGESRTKGPEARARDAKVRRAALAEEFMRDPTAANLAAMAERLNTSPTYVRRLLKEAGVSPLPQVARYVPKSRRSN